MREWYARFRCWITGRRGLSGDLSEEMEAHLAMQTERYVERGMPPAQARAEARRRFGNSTYVAESTREAWGFPAFEGLLKDVRHGFRAIRRAPGFSLVVILTF